jgi:hypothetical protein
VRPVGLFLGFGLVLAELGDAARQGHEQAGLLAADLGIEYLAPPGVRGPGERWPAQRCAQRGAALSCPGSALVIGTAYLAWRSGYFSRESRRAIGHELGQAARDGLAKIDGAFSAYDQAKGDLLVIESYGPPTVDQLSARHLARVGRPAHAR